MDIKPPSSTLEGAFGAVLRQLREIKGLSQEELADQCRIHRTYVSQLERGLKSPTLQLIWQICASLEVSPLSVIGSVQECIENNKRTA